MKWRWVSVCLDATDRVVRVQAFNHAIVTHDVKPSIDRQCAMVEWSGELFAKCIMKYGLNDVPYRPASSPPAKTAGRPLRFDQMPFYVGNIVSIAEQFAAMVGAGGYILHSVVPTTSGTREAEICNRLTAAWDAFRQPLDICSQSTSIQPLDERSLWQNSAYCGP